MTLPVEVIFVGADKTPPSRKSCSETRSRQRVLLFLVLPIVAMLICAVEETKRGRCLIFGVTTRHIKRQHRNVVIECFTKT